jgi:hypothetical protein
MQYAAFDHHANKNKETNKRVWTRSSCSMLLFTANKQTNKTPKQTNNQETKQKKHTNKKTNKQTNQLTNIQTNKQTNMYQISYTAVKKQTSCARSACGMLLFNLNMPTNKQTNEQTSLNS